MNKLYGLLVTFLMIVSLTACGGDNDTQDTDHISEPDIQVEVQQEQPVCSKVDIFIGKYNELATTPITDAVKVDVTDKESGHYRTEFRLGAFSESEAKTGHIGDIVVDIVCYGKDNADIRVYADGIDLEQAKEIIRTASPIMDNELSEEELQDTLYYIDENKEANGYYYGNLGLTLLGKYQEGYELMLKAE